MQTYGEQGTLEVNLNWVVNTRQANRGETKVFPLGEG